MNVIFIIILITFGFSTLLAVSYKPKSGKKPRRARLPQKPTPSPVVMGPENPKWLTMYAEEMAKRNTALTSSIIKKWLAEDSLLDIRPDITR